MTNRNCHRGQRAEDFICFFYNYPSKYDFVTILLFFLQNKEVMNHHLNQVILASFRKF